MLADNIKRFSQEHQHYSHRLYMVAGSIQAYCLAHLEVEYRPDFEILCYLMTYMEIRHAL